jgi:hypothetical protein
MKTAWYESNGEAKDVMTVGERPTPQAGAGEVRVKLHTSGVNPSDVKSRRARPLGGPYIIPHSDGAGVIDQVGAGVPASRMGERVWTWNAQWQRPDGTAADLGPADPRFIGRLAEEAVVTLEFGTPLALHAGTPAILLDGWVEYPYSSTGFAMWQARAPYQAPSIEAQDPADGSWKLVTAECGYPAGMPRRCVLPLPAASLPAGTKPAAYVHVQPIACAMTGFAAAAIAAWPSTPGWFPQPSVGPARMSR